MKKKYRAMIRVNEAGEIENTTSFLDRTNDKEEFWARQQEVEPSSYGGNWYKVEVEIEVDE